MGKDVQKQTLKLLEDFIDQLESEAKKDESIENNSGALLRLMYLERVADFMRTYPDVYHGSKDRNKREKRYKQLETLRLRIAQLGTRLPDDVRERAVAEFNDMTTVTGLVKDAAVAAASSSDSRSSKEFVDDWIEKHPPKEK